MKTSGYSCFIFVVKLFEQFLIKCRIVSVLAFVTEGVIIINMLLAKVILYPLLWIQKDFYKCDCIRYRLLLLREMVLLSPLLLQMIFLRFLFPSNREVLDKY